MKTNEVDVYVVFGFELSNIYIYICIYLVRMLPRTEIEYICRIDTSLFKS